MATSDRFMGWNRWNRDGSEGSEYAVNCLSTDSIQYALVSHLLDVGNELHAAIGLEELIVAQLIKNSAM
jgi:hypothetical protein